LNQLTLACEIPVKEMRKHISLGHLTI